MRTLRFLGMTLLMVMLAVNFTACSDDENDKLIIDSVVGFWVSETHAGAENDYTNTMVLNEDGTGALSITYTFYPEKNSSEEITYSYDGKSTLTINHLEGDYSDTYKVEFFNQSEDGILEMAMWQGDYMIAYHKVE